MLVFFILAEFNGSYPVNVLSQPDPERFPLKTRWAGKVNGRADYVIGFIS
jgi:hypothetical protein